MIALVAFTPFVIVRRLAAHPFVNIDTVAGAADIYLLFGLFFAVVYGFVGTYLAHGSGNPAEAFFIASRPVAGTDFVYYSFVTLTTVGYGDIVASTPIGRMLSITEALLGQLYLVIVVALLVANIGRSRQKRLIGSAALADGETDEGEGRG
jgi:voltage-gated potassium channel Kch